MKKAKKEIDFSDSSESGESSEGENESEYSESKDETEDIPEEKEKRVIISPIPKRSSLFLECPYSDDCSRTLSREIS